MEHGNRGRQKGPVLASIVRERVLPEGLMAESDLLALLRPHYARADQEGRTLLHELFTTAGDISVCDGELHITLAPLSSPHRTHAAQALCEMLDQTATIFPGSRLRIRFAVRPPPRIGLAFPGSPVERS